VKTRKLHVMLIALLCLGLLSFYSISGAQAPLSPLPPWEEDAESTFPAAPSGQNALEEPVHAKGYVPPAMDLSHLTGQNPPDGGVQVQALASTFDWRDKDGQNYVTPVKNQSTCGCCYAFAALGNFESKILIDGMGTYDLSENHAKECNWYDASCSGGNFYQLASLFSKKGTVLEADDPFVPSDVPCSSGSGPFRQTLLDWRIISAGSVADTTVLKQYIQTYGPVYTAMYAGYYDAWDTEFSSYDGSYTLYYSGTEMPNHAVLIVGWDDSRSHAGGSGAWLVKNSWGTGWGDSGYFWIAYGSASIGMDASFVYDWQEYDSQGDLLYYDQGGWSAEWGGAGTTAWGMAVYTATASTYATRVEFWTTDSPATVDVSIYDDFDGSTLSNQLGQSLGNSFNEAGYHSVMLDPPIPLNAGNDVFVAVKFANGGGYIYPVPIDVNGPAEGRTSVSIGGVYWTSASKDVAIRLRTSADTAPNVSITKQVIGNDFDPGDPITFTLSVANGGGQVAAHPVVTDALPSQVLNPTFDSTLDITPTGTISYVWDIEPLEAGETGVITIAGQIDPSWDGETTFTNEATIGDPEDDTPSSNTSWVFVAERRVYLPLTIMEWPPTETVNLYSTADADVRQGYATLNRGSETEMWTGYDHCDGAQVSRALLQFDLSGISSGASIEDATLHVYHVDYCDIGNRTHTVTAYRTSSSWLESSVTWNTQPGTAEGYGSVSITSGTWDYYTLDVTDLVRAWVGGTYPNYGITLRGPESSGNDSARLGFYARERSGTSLDPYLSVTYTDASAASGAPAVGETPGSD